MIHLNHYALLWNLLMMEICIKESHFKSKKKLERDTLANNSFGEFSFKFVKDLLDYMTWKFFIEIWKVQTCFCAKMEM